MRRAQRRKYHYIYKTTNILNGKYYIGMHSTDDLNDGYIGSGKRLWHSINKHGRENHVCEILEFLPGREHLILRESEIVDFELLKDDQCLNIALGGELSGFHTKSQQKNATVSGNKSVKRLENPVYHQTLSSAQRKRAETRTDIWRFDWTGAKHSASAKKKIGEATAKSQRGELNSQYGTCWIFNSTESIKIKKSDLNKYLAAGWLKGRKIYNLNKGTKMKVNDLFESESKMKQYVWRDDTARSSWKEIKLPLQSVDDMEDISPMEAAVKEYLGHHEWTKTDEYQVKLSGFTVTSRSDVKDDYIKFSVVAKTIYNNDPKEPRNSEKVYNFTLSHDE